MGSKMKNAPIYLSLGQVSFNPIWALDSYAPAIQDNLRKHGFPDVEKGVLNTFNLTVDPGVNALRTEVPVQKQTQYSFFDIARTSGFVLNQSALTFQTTEYDVFETFLKTFMQVLEVVHSSVELSFTERVGLRYLDAVLPKQGETLQAYLNECVHGLYGSVTNANATLQHSFSETVFQSDGVQVTSRCVIRRGQLGYPPDLMPQSLKMPSRLICMDGEHATLDTDGSILGREAFSVKDVRDRFRKIHAQIGEAFTSMVTKHAMETWT